MKRLAAILVLTAALAGCGSSRPPTRAASTPAQSPTMSRADLALALSACEGWKRAVKAPDDVVTSMEANKPTSMYVADPGVIAPAQTMAALASSAPGDIGKAIGDSAKATEQLGLKMKAWRSGTLDVAYEIQAFHLTEDAATTACASLPPVT